MLGPIDKLYVMSY